MQTVTIKQIEKYIGYSLTDEALLQETLGISIWYISRRWNACDVSELELVWEHYT